MSGQEACRPLLLRGRDAPVSKEEKDDLCPTQGALLAPGGSYWGDGNGGEEILAEDSKEAPKSSIKC